MKESRASYRYALALIEVAEDLKSMDAVSADLDFIGDLLKSSRELFLFLKSPVVNKEKKKRVLTDILTNRVSELTMKFILLLTAKDREGLLPEIVHRYSKLRDERMGIARVTARTAVLFTEQQKAKLIQQLERSLKKNIRVTYEIDSSLKGGFTVQSDDTVWDASVKRQLEILERLFAEGTPA